MPRPLKWRKVCSAPRCTRFSPLYEQDTADFDVVASATADSDVTAPAAATGTGTGDTALAAASATTANAATKATAASDRRSAEMTAERVVEMTVDEYETIRLIDFEGYTQELCAKQMEVARTTVQAIYQSARKKLADCIVNSRALVIDGGEYRICEHGDSRCGHGCCHRDHSRNNSGKEEVSHE